ncbi:MAG: hypothetical protein ACTSVI_15260, partial [Promethearchaeota archaeon]
IFKLRKNTIYESIISVFSEENKPYLSPIGVKVISAGENGLKFEAKIFCTASIYRYLLDQGEAVIHFPGQHQLSLYLLGLKERLASVMDILMGALDFKKARFVDAPVISKVKNYVEVKLVSHEIELVNDEITMNSSSASNEKATIVLKSLHENVGDQGLLPICRFNGLFLEYLILFSRLIHLKKGTKLYLTIKSELLRLMDLMEKVSPNDKNFHFINGLNEELMS